jgi:hypothetical protein
VVMRAIDIAGVQPVRPGRGCGWSGLMNGHRAERARRRGAGGRRQPRAGAEAGADAEAGAVRVVLCFCGCTVHANCLWVGMCAERSSTSP